MPTLEEMTQYQLLRIQESAAAMTESFKKLEAGTITLNQALENMSRAAYQIRTLRRRAVLAEVRDWMNIIGWTVAIPLATLWLAAGIAVMLGWTP